VKSTLETLEGNKVKLSVEVEESEFDRDIEAAFRKIAREVRLPGFRPGKAPRRILEARIGVEAARQQALQDGIPDYLAKAVREHSVDLIATPQVEVTGGEESGDVQFDATCEIRPVVEVPGYGGLRVELPAVEATEDEVQTAIDAERRRHGNLEPVDRAVESGDYVTLDLAAHRNGEPVAGLNTEDWLYEVGKGWVAADFDEHLIGKSSGEELTFVSTPSGTSEEAEFSVKVTNVQTLVLPEVTDEWVGEISDQDSVEGWTAALKERLSTGKLTAARNVVLERTTAALAELVDEEPPEALVNSELQQRVQNFVRQLQSQGIQVEQWLQATGQDPASFTEGLREGSAKAVKVDLALRAVATAEGLEVEDHDIEIEYERIAMRVGQKVKDVRKAYEKNDVVPELAAEIRKSKALEWLLHRVEMVDEAGNRLDNDTVLGHSEHDHDGHDHDGHDHDHGDHDHDGHDHDAHHDHGDEGDTE
jgi:trigger factor